MEDTVIHFCAKGNLKMIRYLFSRGADGSQATDNGLTLNGTLSYDGSEIIDDWAMRINLQRINTSKWWGYDKRVTLLVWVHDAVTTHDNFQLVLKGTILSSPLFRRHPNHNYATRSNKRMKLALTAAATTTSPLVIFQGKSGILELISKYVGISTEQDLCTFRQLMVLLPAFIEDVPFDEDDEDADY